MSSWSHSPCSSQSSPRFSAKKIKCDSRKRILRLILHPIALYESQQVRHNILIVRCFVTSYEVLANPLKRQPCISFSLIQVFIELFVSHQFPDLGSYKYTLLLFASLTFRNLFLKYSNPRPVLSIPFTRFFHEAQVYVQKEQINFLRKKKRRIDDIFPPGASDVRLGHSLFQYCFFFSRLSHSQRKQQYFCNRAAFQVTVPQLGIAT